MLHIEVPTDADGLNKGHAIIEFASNKQAKNASQSMNGFVVTGDQKLRVNIMTDGPVISSNQREDHDLNDEKGFIGTG